MSLSLERRNGQQIRIGDNCIIRVDQCDRGRCRLQIIAPRSVLVDRQELVDEDKWAEIALAARKDVPPEREAP